MPQDVDMVPYRLIGLLSRKPGERIAVTTSTGHTIVDAKKLVRLPAVRKMLQKMAQSRDSEKPGHPATAPAR